MFAPIPESVGHPYHSNPLVESDGLRYGNQYHADTRPELPARLVQQSLADAESLCRSGNGQLGDVAAPDKVGDAACDAHERIAGPVQSGSQDQIGRR